MPPYYITRDVLGSKREKNGVGFVSELISWLRFYSPVAAFLSIDTAERSGRNIIFI